MDAPLAEEAKLIAEKVDEIAAKETTNTINLIGHSKCGTMFFNMPKFFQNEESYKKSNIYTSAAPFQGCLIASPKFFLKQVKESINSALPSPLNTLVYKALKKHYRNVHSNSHMDYDISRIGNVAENYDPDFIAGMFDYENIEAMKRVNFYHNFTTGIDNVSLIKALRRLDYLSIGLCLASLATGKFVDYNDIPTEGITKITQTTDGFIEVSSQESVRKHLDVPTKKISSATHFYLSHDDEVRVILDVVNETIDRINSKRYEKKYIRLYPIKK